MLPCLLFKQTNKHSIIDKNNFLEYYLSNPKEKSEYCNVKKRLKCGGCLRAFFIVFDHAHAFASWNTQHFIVSNFRSPLDIKSQWRNPNLTPSTLSHKNVFTFCSMVENNKNRSKIIKKNTFFIMRTRGSCKTYVEIYTYAYAYAYC